MKRVFLFILMIIMLIFQPSIFAQNEKTRGRYGSEPMEILKTVVGEANKNTNIQETALDDISDKEGSFVPQYKISNTLDYIRINMAPYIQWLIYIGLVLSVILIIYNGFLMVTHAVHKQGDFTNIKKRIGYIAIGILLLTGFYAIIKLVVGLLNSIFGTGPGGETGF